MRVFTCQHGAVLYVRVRIHRCKRSPYDNICSCPRPFAETVTAQDDGLPRSPIIYSKLQPLEALLIMPGGGRHEA